MKWLFFIFAIIAVIHCHAQTNYGCKIYENPCIQYSHKKHHKKKIPKSNHVVIHFNSGFGNDIKKTPDQVLVFVNDSLIGTEHLLTNPVLSYTGVSLSIESFSDREVKVKIILPEKNLCTEFTVNKKYRSVAISRYSPEAGKMMWSVIYSNYVAEYE